MRSEAALCLAFDKVSEARGVTTPAACLGMPLVERLRRAGMTFEVDLGAPPCCPASSTRRPHGHPFGPSHAEQT